MRYTPTVYTTLIWHWCRFCHMKKCDIHFCVWNLCTAAESCAAKRQWTIMPYKNKSLHQRFKVCAGESLNVGCAVLIESLFVFNYQWLTVTYKTLKNAHFFSFFYHLRRFSLFPGGIVILCFDFVVQFTMKFSSVVWELSFLCVWFCMPAFSWFIVTERKQ